MKFDHEEKLAIIHMTYAVILVDGKVHRGEIAALHKLKFHIGFDSNFIGVAQSMDRDVALVTMHNMSYDKKLALSKILDEIAISDNHLHEKEIALIIDTFKNIGIGEELE